MGRQQYLERLALGRSPFEDPDPAVQAEVQETPGVPTRGSSDQQDGEFYQQQYDSKGRPINSRTEERNAAMRNAQNAVLALVGIVESKDGSDARAEASHRPLHDARERMLQAGQERGEELGTLALFLHRTLTWWPEAFVARVQSGLYASSSSLAEILIREGRMARYTGVRGFLTASLAGMPAYGVCILMDTLLCAAFEQLIGSLITALGRYSKGRKAAKYLKVAETVATEAVYVIVSAALMPFEYYAETQRLGLAPALPFYASWRLLLPTDPSSTHKLIWTTPLGMTGFRFLGSPGLLLFLRNYLFRYQGEEVPIGSQFTTFQYPALNEPVSSKAQPALGKDPLGTLLYHAFLLRSKLLKWFGWELERSHKHRKEKYGDNCLRLREIDTGHQNEPNTSDDEDNEAHHTYRSTSLSQQPAKYLAERIDAFFARLLTLPFESMVVRAVTHSYLASSLPKTPLAIMAVHTYYAPFGGGPLGILRASGLSTTAWNELGRYVSKVGLSLALYCSAEIGTFFILYKLCRWQGVRNFRWGGVSEPNRTQT